MNLFSAFILSFIVAFTINAQHIVSSSGKKLNSVSSSLNFTIGESIILSTPKLGLGFHNSIAAAGTNISGTIYNYNYTSEITTGKVYLIDYDTAIIQFAFIDSFNLDGTNGNYLFSNVTTGDYLIYVKPNKVNYPDAFPTYFGDTAFWKGATILNVSSDTTEINIAVREFPAFSGNGFISGLLRYGIGTGKTGNGNVTPFGDPVPGIDISLEEIPGGIIRAHTETNDSGFFSFSDLPLNSTFKLLVDIPGLPMDSTYTFSITPTDTIFNNLNFVVDTTSDGTGGIYVGYPLGTLDLGLETWDFRLYPNPNDGTFTIELPSSVFQLPSSIKIYNVLGEIVFHSTLTDKLQFINIKVPSGIYNVQVISEKRMANNKIIVE